MKKTTKRRVRLLVLCYLAGLVVWLCVAGFLLARDTVNLRNGTLARHALQVSDFEQVGVVSDEEAGTFASTDPDSQLIYTFEAPTPVTRFVFRGRPLNKGGGEMVLYYMREGDEGFSDTRKLWAKRGAGGEWYFDLHGMKVTKLRFDPDSVGGVYWQTDGFILNERIEPMFYFVPGAQTILLLVVLPLFGWALLCEGSAFLNPIFARRRFESRWAQLEAEAPGAKPKK